MRLAFRIGGHAHEAGEASAATTSTAESTLAPAYEAAAHVFCRGRLPRMVGLSQDSPRTDRFDLAQKLNLCHREGADYVGQTGAGDRRTGGEDMELDLLDGDPGL